MMKRMFCLLLTVLMGVSCIFASAEDAQDNSADALTLAELQAFAARMQTLAMASTPLNDPADAKTEDGYAFEYSFGTIYADSPAMSIDTQLLSIVLTSAEEQGPRDIQVGDELSIVLEANYSENPSLRGSRESAVLYVLDLLPESMRWGEVKRDGQRVQTVEYAVHERVETDGEGYTDTGVIFTMEDNIVSAIRVYGLSARTTEAEISTVRDNLRFDALFDDYVQVPSSYNGADLPMFDGTDLQFSGIDLMSLTPESAADVLGDVIDDVWVENGTDGYVRTMTFAACDITFLYDAQKQNPQVEMLSLIHI